MTPEKTEMCPVCDGENLIVVDVPDHKLLRCATCNELLQRLPGGVLSPIGRLLQRNALGDDRVRAAISAPHVNSGKSFIDVFDVSHRMSELSLAEARGGLRVILTQMENRLDLAISKLVGLDLASDAVGDALAAIREARELASPLAGRNRGIPAERT